MEARPAGAGAGGGGAAGGADGAPPAGRALMHDRGVAALVAAAGSDEAVSRGRWLAVATVAVGVLGALGVGLRPVYRQAFAARAAAEAAGRAAADAATRTANADRIQALSARLAVLQARHRARHPLWYGEALAAGGGGGGGGGAGGGGGGGGGRAAAGGSGGTARAAV